MEYLDLSGIWEMSMTSDRGGRPPVKYDDVIRLPDSTSRAHKGCKSGERFSGYLTDPYAFEGCLWVRREVVVPENWEGMEITLMLERTRRTSLFLDGEWIGAQNSLCTPHRYVLPALSPGCHKLEIAVRNTGYPTRGGHMTSPDTQTNWLGILGRMALEARPRGHITEVKVLSSTRAEEVRFFTRACQAGEAEYRVDSGPAARAKVGPRGVTLSYRPAEPLGEWDEFSPVTHTLEVTMNGDTVSTVFGVRRVETFGRRLLVNGRETFLRGRVDCMLFPETGYAPMDEESWARVMSTAKAYGINHYRFHTCCPPEAAFSAADRLGIYLEPELPFWGTVPEEDTAEWRYLKAEGIRIQREFGNHPSFLLMSLGNELWGSVKRLEGILLDYRRKDDRHLYTDGSNNFQFAPAVLKNADFLCGVRLSEHRLYRGSYAACDGPQGFIQTDAPETVHTYDDIITCQGADEENRAGRISVQVGTESKIVESGGSRGVVPQIPVISHEVGQYEVYPDYGEIARYTGVLKAENIRLYRENAERKGLLPWADRFFRASGALAADCYKREIEAALKSRELSGFQLLDLMDFSGQGTALVGMLNAFMEPKGIISAEEFRQFCAPTVIMAAFPKFVYSVGEEIAPEVLLFNTDPGFAASSADYRIESEGKTLLSGTLPILPGGRVTPLGAVRWHPEELAGPAVCRLILTVPGTAVSNSYRFTVYPRCSVRITRDMIETEEGRIPLVRSLNEAEELFRQGKTPLLVPEAGDSLPGTYCTDFWCYPMFYSIAESMGKQVPVGTLGCLIEKDHPALKTFPAETYSTPDWYEIITHSHCEDLSEQDGEPVVWVIDNPHRALKLALLYEKTSRSGRVLGCTSRLWEIADAPEVKWFARGLVRYLTGRDRGGEAAE